MAHEHPSGVPGAHDRTAAYPEFDELIFSEGRFNQSAEFNEIQSQSRNRDRRIGNMTAQNGDRVSGCEAVVDIDAETITLTAGQLYIDGDVRSVGEKVISGIAVTGSVEIGVWLTEETITASDNPDLYGLAEGSRAEGEEGADRLVKTITWGEKTDEVADGKFHAVYRMTNGTVIDQTPPPTLSGISQAIAVYDRDVNGNYIVQGMRVTALGKSGSNQIFSMSEGIANIVGNKRTRNAALRFSQVEEYDVLRVIQENHTYVDNNSGSFKIELNQSPLATVVSATVTKEVTSETVIRATGTDFDSLANTGITEIVSVVQGGTTFVADTDYSKTGDQVEWLDGGSSPASSSSYQVTYRYTSAATPVAFDDYSVTLEDGVVGEPATVTYDFKLNRTDIICLDELGDPVYLKGISTRGTPYPPLAPEYLLKVCEVSNTWVGPPTVSNNGTRALNQDKLTRMLEAVIDNMNLIGIERLRRDIDARETSAKKGRFVDPFTSDRYRDAGITQSAAVFEGSCQLPVTPSFFWGGLTAPVTLDFTEEIIISQPLATGCVKINPYGNFEPLPGEITLTPALDFWTEEQTEWASPVTQRFGSGNQTRTTTSTQQIEDDREELLEFLRQISVDFAIKGFGDGEVMESFTFDGVDILPDPAPTADSNGEITGSFTIPENITAGTKSVIAVGAGGTVASAQFSGQGILLIDVFRRVTTVRRTQDDRPTATQNLLARLRARDPQAQSFNLVEGRHIAGVDVKFCAIGDRTNGVICEIVTVENGDPTQDVVTQAFVPMTDVVQDEWTEIRFDLPVYLPPNQNFAFVFKTDDADHSIAIATLGDFDEDAQQFVTTQPYTIGVRSSSSNAIAWTHHNDSDLTFRVVAATFDPTTKVVNLGDHDVVKMSDILVHAAAEVPTGEAQVYFEIVREDGTTIYTVNAFEPLELPEYITETVTLRAVLKGSEKVSPALYPDVEFIPGELQTEGTYVGRVMTMGNPVQVFVWLKTKLPGSSTLAVEVDKADEDWTTVPQTAVEPIENNWIEATHSVSGHAANSGGRIKLTLTGSPDARPSVADLRAGSI
jgi:hypothetical protein